MFSSEVWGGVIVMSKETETEEGGTSVTDQGMGSGMMRWYEPRRDHTNNTHENTRSNNVKCLHHRYKADEGGLLSSWKLFWQSIGLSMTGYLFAGSHWWVGIDIEYMFGLDILFCLLNIITIFFYVMPHDSITQCIAHCPVYLTCYMSILLDSFCVS